MCEIWKHINGYEQFYMISNLGRVKSIAYVHEIGRDQGRKRKIIQREKILKPWNNGNGYLVVSLNDGNKRKNRYVHRLVAEHFIDNPNNAPVINHIDYDKNNNRVDNLEWVTQKENTHHSSIHMRRPHNTLPGKSGEKYIKQKVRNNKTVFIVYIRQRGVCKQFRTLGDAVNFRNEVLNG